jgi:hypothetical protein
MARVAALIEPLRAALVCGCTIALICAGQALPF